MVKSPIYCDNRLLLSYPKIRKFIADKMSEIIKNKYGQNISITGVASGAIAIGALIAERLNLPYSYVRPEPKSHGLKNQIEGFIDKESEVLVIEDLISTGKSSLNAIMLLEMKILLSVECFLYSHITLNLQMRGFKMKIFQLTHWQITIL